eukprot:s3577_g8.t1
MSAWTGYTQRDASAVFLEVAGATRDALIQRRTSEGRAVAELMHEAVARLNVEGLRDFCDYVAADVTKGLEVVASSFEHLLAKHLKVPLDLFTSNLTEDPSFSSHDLSGPETESSGLELKVLCSEMQKAAPLAFQKLSDVPGTQIPAGSRK